MWLLNLEGLLDDLSTFCGNSRAEWNVTISRPSLSVYNKLSSTIPQLSIIHVIIMYIINIIINYLNYYL